MTQSRRRLLPITRIGSLRSARARSGSPMASVYKQTTNHTLFYKLNRAVQRGQLQMHTAQLTFWLVNCASCNAASS